MNPLDVVIANAEELDAEDVIYYAAAKQGWLLNMPTLFGVAQIVIKESPEILPKVTERFVLNGKKIPMHMLTQFHDLARKNFDRIKSECSAYLTYNPDTDDWKLFIPEQHVSHTSVNHRLEAGAIKHGYQAIGTIHSHCDFNAFHSGTDKHDMGKMPGLHITIGHVNTDHPDFDFALSVHDSAFTIKYDQIVDVERPLDKNGYATAPDHWLRFIKQGTAPWGRTGVTTTYHQPYKNHTYHKPSPQPSRFPQNTYYQPATREQHWSEWWNADDYDWYQETGTVQQHLWEKDNQPNDPFEEYADDIAFSETRLESEAIHLALNGFALSFSITHNPRRAQKYLAKQGIFYADGDDTPLLPEVCSGSAHTSK
jgi:PRTRC genetic system protein A